MSHGPHIELTRAQSLLFRRLWRSGVRPDVIAKEVGFRSPSSAYKEAERQGLITNRVYARSSR